MTDIGGSPRQLNDYRGKVLIVVNVASKCGFTGAGHAHGRRVLWHGLTLYQTVGCCSTSTRPNHMQLHLTWSTAPSFAADSNYQGLQQLYSKYREQGLEVLAFPCNQVWVAASCGCSVRGSCAGRPCIATPVACRTVLQPCRSGGVPMLHQCSAHPAPPPAPPAVWAAGARQQRGDCVLCQVAARRQLPAVCKSGRERRVRGAALHLAQGQHARWAVGWQCSKGVPNRAARVGGRWHAICSRWEVVVVQVQVQPQ